MEFQFRGFCESRFGTETICVDGKNIVGDWFYGYYQGNNTIVGCVDVFTNKMAKRKVVPQTVGMSFEQTDKNGGLIHVGDIIELVTEDGEKITIECKFGTVQRQIYENLVEITGFYFERSNDGRKTFPIVNNYLGKHDTEIWEVIGTIFDVKEEAK